MTVALWILGAVAALLAFAAGGLKLFASTRWLVERRMAWAASPAPVRRILGVVELIAAAGIVAGLVLQDQWTRTAWWGIVGFAVVLLLVTVGMIIVRARRRERVLRPAVTGAFAAVTLVIAALLAASWPGGVTAPTVAVPDNPMWKGDTKPDPVPAGNVVLSMPKDMYRHKDAPTEWWWHIGTLRAGDRVFGFEINAASMDGFAMSQLSVSDVAAQEHYEHTQVYIPKPVGFFDVSQWAEGDPGKDWYARMGDRDWAVGGFVVTDGGSGYKDGEQSFPVTIEGDGSGASAIAVVDGDSIGQIVLLQPGSGYTGTPTVRIDGGSGSGAKAEVVRNAISMTAPQEDPTQNIAVEAVFSDVSGTQVEFDLTFSQQGRPFFVFGTGLEPSATVQSLAKDNYYFSFTRLAASGTITIGGETHEVSGTTWMDHEYGYFGGNTSDSRVRWLLQDMQLDNGYTISNAGIIGEGYTPEIGVSVEAYATIQDADGELYYVASVITPVGELWQSPVTGRGYATQFQVEIPSFDAAFVVSSRIPDQEFAIPGGSIYEGTSDVTGRILGEPVSGDAWIEQAF